MALTARRQILVSIIVVAGLCIGADKVIVAGDSAGGGLALLPAQSLASTDRAMPGAKVSLREYPGMFHVWVGAPIPEAKRALAEAAAFIDSGASAGADQGKDIGPAPILFRHVRVLSLDSEVVLNDRRVSVRGDRIQTIEPDDGSPVETTSIDGHGFILMPGLVDFHTHTEGWEELPSYVAAGVTTIVTMDGEALTGRRYLGGDLPRPNFIASSEILDGDPPINRRFYAVDAAHAAEIVDQEKTRGAKFLKIYSKLGDPARTALLSAARERGMLVGGHIPQGADLKTLFKQGFALVAHGEEYFQYFPDGPSAGRINELADITAKAHVAVIPDLVGYTAMSRQATRLTSELTQPDVASLSPAVYQEWLPRRNRYATRDNPEEFAHRVDTGLPVLQQLAKALFHGVMVSGKWMPMTAILDAKLGVRKKIAAQHASVDRYEKMIVAQNLAPLFMFLRTIPVESEILNANVLIFDALGLEQAGRLGDGIALLENAAHIFRRQPGAWNTLGTLRLKAGDTSGAKQAFGRALKDRPYDGIALEGMSKASAR